MRLILNPKLKDHTTLGWEWLEPISYGYDNKGILQSMLCKAGHKDGSLPPYDVVDLVDIQEPELSEDLMMFYTVSTATNEQPEASDECSQCSGLLYPSYSELLEALEQYDEFSKQNDDWRDDDDIPDFVVKARQAISKAKGGE